MKIVDYALNHKSFTWMLMLATLIGGIYAYFTLGRLEYPTFKIKKATVATSYPGATAKEVETEITDKIEEELQKMASIDNITSISKSGLSIIFVEIKPEIKTSEIQQIWDELRRKVNDIKPYLPSGVSGTKIGDDFGDIYGIFLTLTGDGYTIDELKDYADILKKELLRIKDVAKIVFWGIPDKAIYVEFNRAKLSNLKIPQTALFQTLSSSNMIEDAGAVKIEDEYSRFRITGAINGVEAIQNLYVAASDGSLFKISDIAEVKRGHTEPSNQIMTFNGKPAIGIGISTVDGGNVVKMGEAVQQRIKEMENSRPLGMRINHINFQSDIVKNSLKTFMVNLIEAVAIVIGILFITMGWQAGIVIGITLILIILGTFIVMLVQGIDMQMVSLGALIIALGMLVDNAIVIVDGYLVKTARGSGPKSALKDIANETQLPLLGATFVAICAFLAVGFNEGNVGEFCRSLFDVINISLLLSWIMALVFTPLLCLVFIKPQPIIDESKDVYGGKFYKLFDKSLRFCLEFKWSVLILMCILLIVSIVKYANLPKTFFPDSTRPQFYIDYWRNQASHIDETQKDITEIASYIKTLPGVTTTATFAGEGTIRFLLSYDYNSPTSDYGQIIVDVDDYTKIASLTSHLNKYIRERYPSSDPKIMKFVDTKAIPFTVEARFRGPDENILRTLAEKAKTILRNSGNAINIRDDWRAPVKANKLTYSEIKGRRTGITRKDLAQAVKWNFNGITCGVLRENNQLIPIISRPIEEERQNITQLENIRVWSSTTGKSYSLAQVCDDVQTIWEDHQIRHRDRVPTITVQCSQINGTASDLREAVKKQIESIELPPLYSLEWGGEYEENEKAQAKIRQLFPISIIIMFLIVASLFRTARETFTAFSILPFAIIGVVAGLNLLGLPFGFLAILGFLGLSGMLLKNSIVLLDQINLELKNGKTRYEAIISSTISRLRPVTMAAGTTILGVAPLLSDAFYNAMAATIMFGLLGATLMTLLVVPVVYSILFNVKQK